MSSPIHLDEDIDTALIYAPPKAREAGYSIAGPELETRALIVPAIDMDEKKARPKFSGDRAMLDLRRQLALDPDLIPEPSSRRAALIWPLLTRLCSVGALAAFLAWTMVSYSGIKNTAEDRPADNATVAIANKQVGVIDASSSRSRETAAETHILTSKPRAPKVAAIDAEAVAMTATAHTTAAQAPVPRQAATERRELRLDTEEIAVLIKRAKDLLGDGDVAAARLLLRRAAEAGSAEGAFTLGTTFDPVLLQRLGAIGAIADVAKARQWYQRAAELGSKAASQQLAGLGNAP